MKKFEITDEQVKAIINTFYQANVPVQMFEGLKKLLEKLPELAGPSNV